VTKMIVCFGFIISLTFFSSRNNNMIVPEVTLIKKSTLSTNPKHVEQVRESYRVSLHCQIHVQRALRNIILQSYCTSLLRNVHRPASRQILRSSFIIHSFNGPVGYKGFRLICSSIRVISSQIHTCTSL